MQRLVAEQMAESHLRSRQDVKRDGCQVGMPYPVSALPTVTSRAQAKTLCLPSKAASVFSETQICCYLGRLNNVAVGCHSEQHSLSSMCFSMVNFRHSILYQLSTFHLNCLRLSYIPTHSSATACHSVDTHPRVLCTRRCPFVIRPITSCRSPFSLYPLVAMCGSAVKTPQTILLSLGSLDARLK